MSRPCVNGPRSLIVTTVEAPVRGFVSFTPVPNGSFLCAAVRTSSRNASPLAVPEPTLYWVAFIEPLGQPPWVGAAMAALPNQAETSNKGSRVRVCSTWPISRCGRQNGVWLPAIAKATAPLICSAKAFASITGEGTVCFSTRELFLGPWLAEGRRNFILLYACPWIATLPEILLFGAVTHHAGIK
jgi:hypothetical protein